MQICQSTQTVDALIAELVAQVAKVEQIAPGAQFGTTALVTFLKTKDASVLLPKSKRSKENSFQIWCEQQWAQSSNRLQQWSEKLGTSDKSSKTLWVPSPEELKALAGAFDKSQKPKELFPTVQLSPAAKQFTVTADAPLVVPTAHPSQFLQPDDRPISIAASQPPILLSPWSQPQRPWL